MRTIIILFISVAVVLPATESNPRVTRVIDSFSEASQSAQEAYEEGLRQLEEARAQALNRARERAVRDLKRLVNNRTDAATTAVVYREVLTLDQEDADARRFFEAIGTLDQVLAGIQPRIETDLLGNAMLATPIVPSGYYLSVWNQRNGNRGDRGTRTIDVELFNGDQSVHSAKGVEVPWLGQGNDKVDIPIPRGASFNRIKIEVVSWHGTGGGLSEIELNVDGNNVLRTWTARASSFYDHRFRPENVLNGQTVPSFGSGYWLLPNNTIGWVELISE